MKGRVGVLLLLYIISTLEGVAHTFSCKLEYSARPGRRTVDVGRKAGLSARPPLAAFIVDASSVLTNVGDFYKSSRYLSAFLISGLGASAADYVTQKRELWQKEEGKFVSKRNLALLLYGGIYQGMAQEYIYNTIFPTLFGDASTIRTVASKVLVDMLIVSPMISLPAAYLFKALVFRDSLSKSFKRYWKDIFQQKLIFKFWAVWVPVQTLNFSIVPPHLRVTVIAVVAFFWLMILSSVSSSDAEP
eukprot:scaffold5097_cov52-Attheya_sp.AAC.10